VGAMEILVPMTGLIDKAAETIRLGKELEKIQKEAKNIKGKLNNESFVEKAPPAIVAKERDRLDELEATSAKLVQQKENIANL
jgi:valyl-tRNA synthetase